MGGLTDDLRGFLDAHRVGVLATAGADGKPRQSDDLDETESVLTELSRSVRVGHASLLAQVSEQSPEVVDAAVAGLDGQVVRRPIADVEAEIAAAEEAQRAAKKEARERLRAERREERKEKVQAKIAKLKSKVHPDRQLTGQAS